MRALFPLIAVCAAVLYAPAALSQTAAGSCEAKRLDIARDIDEAKARKQTQRVRGLEKALREAQANCSDEKLRKEHAARIARQEKKVADRQRELAHARAEGKADKISRRAHKLADEEKTLQALRNGSH